MLEGPLYKAPLSIEHARRIEKVVGSIPSRSKFFLLFFFIYLILYLAIYSYIFEAARQRGYGWILVATERTDIPCMQLGEKRLNQPPKGHRGYTIDISFQGHTTKTLFSSIELHFII